MAVPPGYGGALPQGKGHLFITQKGAGTVAERRMFAKTIIDSDAFLDMSTSAQALYFHLAMRADDDGFVNNPKKIQKIVGAADDDVKVLMAKRFIIGFESGVIVIKHWKMHNYIQNDRYKPTVYQAEMERLSIKPNRSYTENPIGISDVSSLDTVCIQSASSLEAQVRLGKVRKGKTPPTPRGGDKRFDQFWEAYPRKTAKENARKAFAKHKFNDDTLHTVLEALNAQKTSDQWQKEGGQFIPYAATWLNQRRWEDDLPTPAGEVNWAVPS